MGAMTSYGAITSRLHVPHTATPQEINLDTFREDNSELKQKITRPKRANPGNDSFSHTSALTNDNNGYALVHYSGAYSPKIFIVTQRYASSLVVQSNLWRTTDFGREYTNDTNKLPADAIINYFYISLNKEKLILTDQKNNRLYRTLNGGDDYRVTDVSFDPKTLTFHPSIEEAVIAYDSEHMELYISSDFGATWTQIDTGVQAYVWDPTATDPTVYFETQIDNNTYVWKASIVSDKLSKVVFDPDLGAVETNSLLLYNEFIFVEKQLNESDTTGEGGLFVSYKRGKFREAMFPLKTQEQHYLIADASQEQALVAVYHHENLTNLYTSDAEGYTYSLSLQNLKGTSITSWENRAASVELVMIEGIKGTYIANRLDPISSNPNTWPAFTQITYDKGGTWGYIKRPPYDSNGNLNDNCTLAEDCNLNLRIDQPSRSGVYSKEHALGLIVAHGNSGKYLNSYWWGQYYSNVYLSRDAGFTWTEEFYRGSYEYAFLDHGGVIVAVSKYSGNSVYTQSITYSCTEGLSWQLRNISTAKLYVIGILTEPGSTTLEATLFAKTPGRFVEWLIVQLNFSYFVNVTCGPDDYIKWIPSDERQGGDCLLGEKATYERRDPAVCCFNGRDYIRPINTSTCPCKLQDFDCDVGYEKLSTDSPCTPAEGTVPEGAPFDCPEGKNYTSTIGYRLIPGDKCEGGDYDAYAPHIYPCPIRAPTSLVLSPDMHTYKIGAVVTIILSQGYGSKKSTVYRWDYGDNSTQQMIEGFTLSETVTHTYTRAGKYTINLSASNSAGVNNVSIDIVVLDVVDSFNVTGVESPISAGTMVEYSLTVYSPEPDQHVLPVGTYDVRWSVLLGTANAVSISQDTFSYLLESEGVYYINIEVFNHVSDPVVQNLVINVVGIPGALTLSTTTDPALFIPGHEIQINFRQGTETDFTNYSVNFGDGEVMSDLIYSLAENLQHSFNAPGVYTIMIVASNIAGTTTVARNITILDVLQSAVFSAPTIIILGLNEVFEASYTLQYNTEYTGSIMYSWEIGDEPPVESPTPRVTHKFLSATTVTIKLTVYNEVSSITYSLQVVIHPSAENLRIRQDGQTYPVLTKVILNLESADSVELPREGVTYKWDVGEEGTDIIETALPTTTFQYTTTGTKVVRVHSVSLTDGETINHVVSGTLYILSVISTVSSLHNTGTTKDTASVNFTIRDPYDGLYIGPVTVLISDDSHNDWAYNTHEFYVSDGSLELPLSPLIKYKVYKITVTLTNVVSNVSTIIEISRVKEIEQNVIIRFQWVDVPIGVDVNEWEQQVEDTVMFEIIEMFHIETWRLSVELNLQIDKPYDVYVRLLPKNNTDKGANDQLITLRAINNYFQNSHDITISGNTGNQTIPVINSQIINGIPDPVHTYTLIGLLVGLPIVLVLFILLIIPFVGCGIIYARKYRKVSHAYSRLRQTRANNFVFTHDGLDDEDDEPPVNIGADSGDKVKFNLDDTGFSDTKIKD
ncbi:VPS10 domain-containing receptor SorCS1-like [Oopsacas minuta]|uniref:VPS10 domain-containing receptor SorCS1-like n=1 Tax=Oopsacas minuta TaxID=111878 RepID=A0AAV7JJC8_9METZ|nr:VPS10 domain-containing receptor SorCS1-like [Oopsacas minuta]